VLPEAAGEPKGRAEGTLINFIMTQVCIFIAGELGEVFSGLVNYVISSEPRLSGL